MSQAKGKRVRTRTRESVVLWILHYSVTAYESSAKAEAKTAVEEIQRRLFDGFNNAQVQMEINLKINTSFNEQVKMNQKIDETSQNAPRAQL